MANEQRAEAAHRAGVELDFLARLEALGLVTPADDGSYSRGQVRRAQLARTLDQAGVPLEGLAAGVEARRYLPGLRRDRVIRALCRAE